MKKKKGFTLVELLAVIVVLAIILVIAVPKILDVIKSSRENSLISSVKLVAKNAESKKLANEVLNDTSEITCDDVADLNSNDYKSCSIVFDDDGNAMVTIKGKGKFIGYKCSGTKDLVTCEIIPIPVTFRNDSWLTIKENLDSEKYHVGDEKCINLTGITSTNNNGCDGGFLIRIANKSTPTECNNVDFSETACGFVVEFVDIIDEHNMKSSDTNEGSWNESTMREYLNSTIYDALPIELRNAIKETKVVSGYGSGNVGNREDENFESIDNLYLLSPSEIYDNSVFGEETGEIDLSKDTTRQLDYYEIMEVSSSNYAPAIKMYNGSAKSLWLRSASSFFVNSFFIVHYTGILSSTLATSANGVSPVFRIG